MGQSGLRRISIFFLVLALILFIVHVQLLVSFNRQEVNVHGNAAGSGAYMEIDPRANSTSKWLKRDFRLTDTEMADLTGQTIDQTLYNNSDDEIRDWELRINILGDCYVNQAWTGETEIHQYVGTSRETVQRLDLRDYRLEDVKLEYRYDGDLLIPLVKGDYILYYPNEHYAEMPIGGGEKVTIGMIFYFLDELDLSDYDLTVHFHRGFTQGWSFLAFAAAAGLCFLSAVVYFSGAVAYRNAKKQMEFRKSGLSCMSELYEAIYIINLPADEITPVSTGDMIEGLRSKYSSAKELLRTAVREDADSRDLDAVLAFVDTDTLPDRLKDRESVVCEFVSSVYGWCRFRFFAMDRAEGKPLESVIFAVQDINDERSETENLAVRLARAESTAAANSGFLAAASRDLRAPVLELISLDERILSETDPGSVRKHAESIRGVADRMLTLINGLADRAALEAGQGNILEERYSLAQLVADCFTAVRPQAEKKNIRLEPAVSDAIPDALVGDRAKLKETAVSLLANTIGRSKDGAARFSVFGKAQDGNVHLLFSVRFLPDAEDPSVTPPDGNAAPAGPDLDMEVAESLLAGLGSGLKSVRSSDEWKDMYFEIDQRIADPAPAGNKAAEDVRK